MADSNSPNVRNLVTQVKNYQTNPLKRKKPNGTPDTSPQASVNNLAIADVAEIDVEEDTEGRKYIEVVCGGRTGKLILNKFRKLEGNKGYTKCIEYNGKIIPLKNLRP